MPDEAYDIQWPYGLDIDDLVGVGTTAMVARLDAVVKWVKPHELAYSEREKLVYERLGPHPRILRYFGSMTNGVIVQVSLAIRLRWAIQVTEAIDFLHSKAVYHGDISCNNVFLDENLDAKLGDFAGSPIDGTEPLTCYETRYDDPTTNGVVSVSSEIFALGSLFFEIMTGARPYEDLSDNAVERAYANGKFPNVASLEACSCIIQKCWTKRYGGIEDLLRDLTANGK